MRYCLLLAFVLSAQAAVVQGVVLDQESGSPLAHTLVELVPVEGTPARPVTLWTAERGTFAIMNLAPGWYIVRGARKYYAPGEVGQSRAGRPGRPFQLEKDDQSTFVELRLTHLGAASGTVVDENNVGLPDWDVLLYTARKPIRKVAQGKTDDRGFFRIHGLDPGEYIVRSVEGELADGTTLVPTYHRFGTQTIDAAPVAVQYGDTTPDLRIQPVKGRLWSIQGKGSVECDRLTMITDTGRRQLNPGEFRAERLPPGPFDLVAEGGMFGGITHHNLERDLLQLRTACQALTPLTVRWGGREQAGVIGIRRIDLDGAGEWRPARTGDYVTPGPYEAELVPADKSLYVESAIADGRLVFPQRDGRFLFDLSYRPTISVALKKGAPSISGTVLSEGRPVFGAAVFVELFDPRLANGDQRLRLWSLRSDVSGQFALNGLMPGSYRVLSSFDFDPMDRYAMDRAKSVLLKAGDINVQELKMLP